MTPTEEQLAIIEAAKATSDNLLVNALAGTAKTTTIEMICRAVTGIPILSLAFNKKIAIEMQKRLPSHVEARTLNSLGHGVWGQVVGKRLTVDTGKMYTILKGVIDDQPKAAQTQLRADMAEILRWLRYAKRDGYVPPKWAGLGKPVFSDFNEWAGHHDDEGPAEHLHDVVLTCLNRSIEGAYNGQVDFDDQVYMPVIFGGTWPKFPLVCVDEAQDLSPLNHLMIERLYHKRLIAVGDPWQSIYAFRGSVSNGMQVMQKRWSMRELTLSVTFRVPKRGVERAWSRVPHYKWFEIPCKACDGRGWNWDCPMSFDGDSDRLIPDIGCESKETCEECGGTGKEPAFPAGHIETLEEWNAETIPDGAAIICRNNAPLFSCALKLLKAGRSIKLVGMDIGAGLVRVLKKLGPSTLTNVQMNAALDDWMRQELRRAKREETVYEKAECLRVLMEGHHDLNGAIMAAEALFKREGPIQLLSYHKAKGLEWNTVYILDSWRCPSKFAKPGTEEMEQELNAKYVGETRFKEEMYFIDLENFQ